MTNEEYIKNMSTQELADYIYSVYLAGIIQGKKENYKEPAINVDYTDWLKQEYIM